MKNKLHKIILSAVVLLNAPVALCQATEPPPPPPTPPPGLPIDAGVVLLFAGALGLALYYFKNINEKKASK